MLSKFNSFFRRSTTFTHQFSHGGRGFATQAMPFRPGYGLGSFMPKEVVDGMTIESQSRNKITNYEKLIGDIDSTIATLRMEISKRKQTAIVRGEKDEPDTSAIQTKIDGLETSRSSVQDKLLEGYGELIETMTGLIDSNRASSMFNTGEESCVDWTTSKIDYVDRAYDTISVDAQFYVKQGNITDIRDYAASLAAQATASSKSGAFGFGKEMAASIQSSTQSTFSSSDDVQNVEQTLVLNAIATHKGVQQFNPLNINARKLMHGWNRLVTEEGLTDHIIKDAKTDYPTLDTIMTSLQDFGDNQPTVQQGSEQVPLRLAMLSEIFLGSCMVGLVHFVRRTKTGQSQEADASDFNFAASIEKASWFSSITGSAEVAANVANRVANLLSTDEFNLKFNLICMGYLPTLTVNNIETALGEFKDYDPGAWAKPAAEFTATGTSIKDPRALQAIRDNKSTAERQSNMKAVIEASIMGITKADILKTSTAVVDMQTFMNAFDDYAKNAPKQPGVGVPIGMQVKTWNKKQVFFDWVEQTFGSVDDKGLGDDQTTGGGETGDNTQP